MKKVHFFPFWDELEQVLPVMQSQQQNSVKITIVSLELYKGLNQGFLFNLNIRSEKDFKFVKDTGRINIRAKITDDEKNTYTNFQTLATSTSHSVYLSRMVLACRPGLPSTCNTVFVNIGPLEWEHINDSESTFEPILGSWDFIIELK